MTARKSLDKDKGVRIGVWLAQESQGEKELSDLINVRDAEKRKGEGFGRTHSHYIKHTIQGGVSCSSHTYTPSC